MSSVVAEQMIRDMAYAGGESSKTAESESINGGLRSVLLALADAAIGAETMDALFAAVSVLASANDLANGKTPSRGVGKGMARSEFNLEVDVDDF